MAKKKKAASKQGRETVYAKPSVKLYGGEKPPITLALAKELLGWVLESDGDEKFKNNFLLKTSDGVKVRCENNLTNRPLYLAQVQTLQQEHLNKRWRFNGEPIIIGEFGSILNGQHTLVSFVLACQGWEADKEKWSEFWPEEPTMEKLVVFGVSESDEVVNTMDTCKPRSLSDVLFRSKYFQDFHPKERKKVSNITEYAIRLVWGRTGRGLSVFAPRRTFAESLDFLDGHSSLLRCVKHIYEENGDEKKLTNYTSPGYAAGLLYLMASSGTDPSEYRESREEKDLDFSRYEKACDFWVDLAGGDPKVSAIKKVLSKMLEEERASAQNRLSVLIKAWNLYIENTPITPSAIGLKYTEDAEGWRKLDEPLPIVDGIDIGSPDDVNEAHIAAADPNPQEIEARATKVREDRKTTKKKTVKKKTSQSDTLPLKPTTKKKAAKKKKKTLQVGSVRWVAEKTPWRGKVVELSVDAARMLVMQGFEGAGNTKVVALDLLQVSQPKPVAST